MKMPMNWAKEFAEFECTPQEFADRMTMSGSKVETYECEADGIKNVVVGKILEIVPHPDSDHMVVCQVDVGRDAPVQIVTGANNLKVGDLVPAALHVAKLPGGKEIRRGKLRGVESGGMLCSLSELGLTTHDFPNAVEDGILVLDEEWPVGTDAVKALGMDDVCVDFEITPNRPDCLAVRGLARARIAGRLERVVDQPLILLDGAHNAAGADALCHAVDELLKMKRLHVVMGMVRDKDYETCVHEVAGRADDFYACVPDAGERSLDAHTIAELARQSCKSVYECESAEHAIELALEHAKMNDCILICGSLYLIGECEKILRGRPKATD